MKNFSVALMVNGNAHVEFSSDEEKGLVIRFSPEALKMMENPQLAKLMDVLGPALHQAAMETFTATPQSVEPVPPEPPTPESEPAQEG